MSQDPPHDRATQPATSPSAQSPITVEAARALYEKSGGGHDFDHVLRVTALAERIARAEGADVAVVQAAALLHDIGESQGRSDHHLRGAAQARVILRDHDRAFVEAVAHAIEAHRYRSEPVPRTLEAQVVSDADKLDAIGAIGIARVFAYAGARGTPLWRISWQAIAAAGPAGNLDDEVRKPAGGAYTPVHEFVYKLNKIPERLYTKTARALATERQAFMQAFFARLDEELAGEM
jgi:uncharacterized protein